MEIKVVGNYLISGNKYVAIAINQNDEKDCDHFYCTDQTPFGITAMDQAVAWAEVVVS